MWCSLKFFSFPFLCLCYNILPKMTPFPVSLLIGFIFWRSLFSWYSNTVTPLAVLWPKKIMCCSWRWVVVAPNPKDFGLFLAQVVRMIQPKMEASSQWREYEVSQAQHLLCLLDEGKYIDSLSLFSDIIALTDWSKHHIALNPHIDASLSSQ